MRLANGNKLKAKLKELQWATGGPSRSDYEAFLREHQLLGETQSLSTEPHLAETVYRDRQRRTQIACVFARRIASQPRKFGIETAVVTEDPGVGMTAAIDGAAKAVLAARGKSEGLTVLLSRLVDSSLLVAFCKRLGARNDNWRMETVPNPSDRQDRVHVSLLFALQADVEAEILGFGPFTFLPATRRAPITALEIRTKIEGQKKRGQSETARSHLADIPWRGASKAWYGKAWVQTQDARLAVLGGDDSAARARITFAIPRPLWDGHDR